MVSSLEAVPCLYGIFRSLYLLRCILWHLLGGYFYHTAECSVSQMQLSSASPLPRKTEVPIANANEIETRIPPKTKLLAKHKQYLSSTD